MSFVKNVASCEPHVRTNDVHRCFAIIIIIAVASISAIIMTFLMIMGRTIIE